MYHCACALSSSLCSRQIDATLNVNPFITVYVLVVFQIAVNYFRLFLIQRLVNNLDTGDFRIEGAQLRWKEAKTMDMGDDGARPHRASII